MTLVFQSGIDPADWWEEEFRRLMPELDFRIWPEVGDPEAVEFALVWRPQPGSLARFRRLRAIFSLGAGIDHLLEDPDLPAGTPITRVVDPNLTQRMTEYVLLHVLRYHRQHDAYEVQRQRREWRERPQPASRDRRIGILGLGVLGGDAARALAGLGFDVAGFSRTPKDIAGIRSYCGAGGLTALLGRTDILVNLLPLTPALENILDGRLFAALPAGAWLINAGRGRHLVEDDLLAALDSERLAGAALDVFREEPLPEHHPFWSHPKITITPHIASVADPCSVAQQVVDNILRAREGRPLLHAVDLAAGY